MANIHSKQFSQKGIALYMTVVISSLILILALNVAAIFYTQTHISGGMEHSVSAFYAAETGVERTLYEVFQGTMATNCPSNQCIGTLLNGANYTTSYLLPGEPDCPSSTINYCLKSVGQYKETRRGIRVLR
jgi:Tfp pilus assembly protein PilX